MSAESIRNIIFDLGNVLNRCDLDWGIRELAANSTADEATIRAWLAESDVIDRFDSGALSEEGFQNELARVVGWNGTLELLRTIWQEMLSEDIEMVGLLRALQEKGLHVYVLSNINPMHARLLDSSLKFILDAHGYVFSCEVGMIKPNREIFEHTLEKFSLVASETIFIDDREANVAAARELGMIGILHKSFQETKQALAPYLSGVRA
ncbi:MAG TPA: HAD family phosphatase [Candidatus Kapabacteria bacterium]|jgi:putative hydrolase of the HAD superfamily